MSIPRVLYKSMLRISGVKSVKNIENIKGQRLYHHHYLYNEEMYKIVGPHEDRVKNLISYIKFRIKYGGEYELDDLFLTHRLLIDFMKMNENEKIGDYKYDTEIEILDNY